MDDTWVNEKPSMILRLPDERSETDTRHKICTTLLAAREEKACFLFRVATQSVKNSATHKFFTMKSLILAQDER